MSRIGKQKIKIPSGVTAEIKGSQLKIKGPKGDLSRLLNDKVEVQITDGIATFSVKNPEEKTERSLWGTTAAHFRNMIEGVSEGFKKQLEVNGVGFRVSVQGKDLKLEVGFSHPVIYKLPVAVSASVEKNLITLESADKEILGNTAAEIRKIKKPEPYKGKGIKYADEILRRKEGKTAAKTAA